MFIKWSYSSILGVVSKEKEWSSMNPNWESWANYEIAGTKGLVRMQSAPIVSIDRSIIGVEFFNKGSAKHPSR